MLETTRLQALLDRVTQTVTHTLANHTSCSLMLQSDGQPHTAAWSGPLALRGDQIQYDVSLGPGLFAIDVAEAAYLADLDTTRQWPSFVHLASRAGIRCALSLPVHTTPGPVGALNLYGPHVDAFPPALREVGSTFASLAAAALRFGYPENAGDPLHEALAHRSMIDQAIGVLMAQNQCDREQAFALLRDSALHYALTLPEVAARYQEAVGEVT